ncbi:ribonuclease H-like domain-containing protein, partial [Tanacetum coccineum]
EFLNTSPLTHTLIYNTSSPIIPAQPTQPSHEDQTNPSHHQQPLPTTHDPTPTGQSHISPLPKSPSIALSDPNWRAAMYDEYNALVKNSTWLLVLKPPNPKWK